MKCLIGLGNPGTEYEDTRHNLGWMVIDKIAEQKKLSFKAGKGNYFEAKDRSGTFLLVKPTTYMNDSGIAVEHVYSQYGLSSSELLVVYDDLDLPLGTVRIRESGGAGGHHGMESIIYHLRTEKFPRIRLGIDVEKKGTDDKDFVLSTFEEGQSDEAKNMVEIAVNGAMEFIYGGIKKSMNKYNKHENKNMINREEN